MAGGLSSTQDYNPKWSPDKVHTRTRTEKIYPNLRLTHCDAANPGAGRDQNPATSCPPGPGDSLDYKQTFHQPGRVNLLGVWPGTYQTSRRIAWCGCVFTLCMLCVVWTDPLRTGMRGDDVDDSPSTPSANALGGEESRVPSELRGSAPSRQLLFALEERGKGLHTRFSSTCPA